MALKFYCDICKIEVSRKDLFIIKIPRVIEPHILIEIDICIFCLEKLQKFFDLK